MYAWRSWTWISYSVRRRRVLESDMEAGRNFEKPSRLGLLFLSNSFIAHPFSLDPLCAAHAHTHSPCSKYRRHEKRKSRLVGNLPPVDALNLLRFSTPVISLTTRSPSSNSLGSPDQQFSYLFFVLLCSRNEWHE